MVALRKVDTLIRLQGLIFQELYSLYNTLAETDTSITGLKPVFVQVEYRIFIHKIQKRYVHGLSVHK